MDIYYLNNGINSDLKKAFLKLTGDIPRFVESVRDIDCLSDTPQIIVIDLKNMKISDIVGLSKEMIFRSSQAKIIFVNAKKKYDELITSDWPHCFGVFYEGCDISELEKGISVILNGERWITRINLSRMIEALSTSQDDNDNLVNNNITKKELAVLNCLIKGKSNHEIANELYISESTVKSHLYRLFKKIEVSNRTEAINWAYTSLRMKL